MRKILVAAALALAVLTLPVTASADGTETLGAPSVTVTPASQMLVAGAGMHAFPNLANSFNVNVPAGATVRQVLLYWEGHWTDHGPYALHTPQIDGDGLVTVNGNPALGTKIGGSTPFFGQDNGAVHGTENYVAYRADITSLNLVHAGANTLTVNDMLFESNIPTGFPFDQGNDGAGVVVMYDDGTVAPAVSVRDGLDLAYYQFASPLDTTVPQTFTFPPVATPRAAKLGTLAGSVGADFSAHRTNQLVITFDVGAPILIQDPWQSSQGGEWDAANTAITIPANASQMTVQALSAGPAGSTDQPASLSWVSCALSIAGGGQNVCPSGGTFGGTFSTQTLPSGDVKLIFDQSPDFNDNSYGTNIVGWGAKAHKFSDLTGSDKAEFQIKNGLGNVVFDFKIDYLTCDGATTGTPSKCDSRGALGGDGGVVTGNAAWVLNWSTSLAKNLNTLGFCTAGNCAGGGTDLKLNSPPTLGPTDYTLPAGSPYTGWNFHDVYEVTVSKAAWGAAGFGGATVVSVHNSPAKPGATCPAAGGLCAPRTHIHSLDLKYTGASCAASNNPQSGKATCSGDPAGAEPVRVIVTSKDGKTTYFDSLVDSIDVGEVFTASAAAGKSFGADTVVRIYEGGVLLQTLGIHTSCSQPIAVGNKFGSLDLIAGTNTSGP